MKNIHPDEHEIQDFILSSNSNPAIIEHILHCSHCRLKAEQYRQLFTAIHQQEVPAFQFDLTKLVMEQLPQPAPRFSVYNYFNHMVVIVLAGLCFGLLYFSDTLLRNMLSTVTPIATGLIITGAVCILAALLFDMNRKHHQKMGVINFY